VHAGLQRGDRVLVYSGNNLFFPVLFMGILMAGGVFTGANPSFVARELEYQLRDSEARFLIAADESLEVAVEAAAAAGVGKERVFIFDDRGFEQDGRDRLGVRNWNALVASHFEGDRFEWVDPEDPKITTCCINYSSGTTGVPKGVEITHTNYVANGEQVCYVEQLHLEHEQKLKTDRVLCFLP
jgi:4-coumarate--CoA ligase